MVELTDAVRLEKLGEVGDELDAIRSVERALSLGSVHRIIPASTRPDLLDAFRRGMEAPSRLPAAERRSSTAHLQG